MMRKSTTPTLQDVARIAGVSPFTASTVLNGSRSNTRVSAATRLRIEEAAKSLSYHPNATARSLVTRTTRIIGVLIPFVVSSSEAFSDDYASAVLGGITEQAASEGYDILHYTQPWRDDAASVARFRDRRTDGVLVVAPLAGSDVIEALSALDIPVVAISALPLPYSEEIPTGIGFVDVDNAAGIRLAVEHLLQLGHTRIAHLSGQYNSASAVLRRSAWEDVLKEYGVPSPSEYICAGTYDGYMAADALDGLLQLATPPTAIIAGNDHIAFAILEHAKKRGITIPEQLSVVGFDDVPLAKYVDPPLTTVRQPLRAIGRAAAQRLILQISESEDAQSQPRTILLPPELTIRNSTTRRETH